MVIATSDPSVRVRLETSPKQGTRLDLLVSMPDLDRHLAVELKYLTAAWTGTDGGEQFELRSQGVQDIRAYDVVKDLARVERLAADRPGWSGLVLVLSNDPAYWSRPSHSRVTNADAFRIYEDRVLSGMRSWGPRTGDGTRKDRNTNLELRGSYRCRWSNYSSLPGLRGAFRTLAFAVGATVSPTTVSATIQVGSDASADKHDKPPSETTNLTKGQRPAPPVPVDGGAMADSQRYSTEDLRRELARFERELRTAGLKDNSVATYVDRTGRFLKWLDGDYAPRGAN